MGWVLQIPILQIEKHRFMTTAYRKVNMQCFNFMGRISETLYLVLKFIFLSYLFVPCYLHSAKMPGEELALH